MGSNVFTLKILSDLLRYAKKCWEMLKCRVRVFVQLDKEVSQYIIYYRLE